MRRRALLTTVAGTASTAALAGCSGILADSDGSGNGITDGVRPPYDRYLPAGLHEIVGGRDGPIFWALTVDLTSPGEPWGDTSSTFPDEDLLVSLGASTVAGLMVGTGVLTESVGLGRIFGEDGGVERAHFAPVPILEGSFDEDRIASDLEAAGLTPAGTYGGFQFQEVADGPEVVAFDDEHVFVGVLEASTDEDRQPSADRPIRPIVEGCVDALRGDRPTATEEVEAFADLATALPERQCTMGTYDARGELFEREDDEEDDSIDIVPEMNMIDLEGDALGVATAFDMTVEPGTETTFFLAIRYAEAGEVDDESAIREAIAPNAAEPDVAVDGPLAVVSGTYERQSDSDS